MIAFGCSITLPATYARCAEQGICLVAEPDSVVYANAAAGSLARSYNLLLDTAAARDDLEALVLVHQDAEIVDPAFCAKLRRALSDPQVGVVGCVGAIDVRSIAWWEGSVTWASFTHRYKELGGGDVDSISWNDDGQPAYSRTGEVDTVDGFILVLPPWTVHNIRFDESLGKLHGYDFDICQQAREAGRKVVTADLKVIHHHSLALMRDIEGWKEAHMRLAEKWEGRLPRVGYAGGDWKHRARRAEADASAARAQATAAGLVRDARVKAVHGLLDELTSSRSWRLTRPLRAVGRLLRGGDRPTRP